MLTRFLIFVAIFLATSLNTTWAQSKSALQSPVGASNAQKTPPGSKAQVNSQEVSAMRADLQRMSVLLNQMQTNLAFVQTTTTPLKHQFELDIEMWRILMNQMERRLDNISGASANTERQSARPEP
jgi:hypothetical protein